METELNELLERAQSPKQYADCSKEIIALGQKYNLLTSGDMVRATSEEDDAASFLIKTAFEYAIRGLYYEAMEQSRSGNNDPEQHDGYLRALEGFKKKFDYKNLSELDPSVLREIQELENANDLKTASEAQEQQHFLRAMQELGQFYKNESLRSRERIAAMCTFHIRRWFSLLMGKLTIRSMETLKMVKPMALDWFIAITNLSLAVSSKKESPAAMELFSTQIFRMLALFMKVMIAQPSRCLLSIIVL